LGKENAKVRWPDPAVRLLFSHGIHRKALPEPSVSALKSAVNPTSSNSDRRSSETVGELRQPSGSKYQPREVLKRFVSPADRPARVCDGTVQAFFQKWQTGGRYFINNTNGYFSAI